MSIASPPAANPKWMTWLGWIFTVLPCAMLIMSAGVKFSGAKEVTDGLQKMGWDPKLALPLGITELVCTILFLVPQTSVLGAILLAGYMGGAIAVHIGQGESFIVQALIGVVIWLGIFLREPRLRAILPFRSPV